MSDPSSTPKPRVGITVLNYRQPEATLACIESLRRHEGTNSCMLWIENDAQASRKQVLERLAGASFPWQVVNPEQDTLPPPGTVGVIFNEENLGYGAGNNVGLRFLAKHGVPYLWVLNNDTLLAAGSSADLAAAAEARPEVGAWATPILASHAPAYFGATLSMKGFVPKLIHDPSVFHKDPTSYVSGCSLFIRTEAAMAVDFIPEEYFLYYEDPAFSLLLKRAGWQLDAIWSVVIRHHESLSTGRRSPLMEYYSRRNRWFFIQKFFPEQLATQKRRILHTFQKYLLRGRFTMLQVECAAYQDFRAGKTGRTARVFHAKNA